MAVLTIKRLDEEGVDLAVEAADTESGDTASNPDGGLFLYLENSSATNAATATITAVNKEFEKPDIGKVSKTDLAISLAAGEQKLVGPLPKSVYNNSSENVSIAYSGDGAADVNVAAVRA